MDEKQIRKELRHQMGKTGWSLLIYYGIMNVVVIIALFAQMLVLLFSGTEPSESQLESMLTGNGWGYIAASMIAAVLIFLWKKKKFCFHEIWKAERPMTPASFAALVALFLSTQGAFQIFATVMELILNLFGLSALKAIEMASGGADTFSMFLYVGLVAPIMEEIIFRGVLLRMLQPYGKRLAILATAFLFGMFHGNLVQTPYAFAAGLVLGYVAIEYSIGWAMILHMCNNLILGDTFTRLLRLIPTGLGEALYALIIWASVIASVIILTCKRKEIAAYRQEHRLHPWCSQSFFRSAGVIVFTLIMALSMLLSVTPM